MRCLFEGAHILRLTVSMTALLPGCSCWPHVIFTRALAIHLTGWACLGSEDATIKTNPARWPGLWGQLIKDIAKDTPSRNRVFVDLLNEPDHAGLTWGIVSPTPGAAVYLVCPVFCC